MTKEPRRPNFWGGAVFLSQNLEEFSDHGLLAGGGKVDEEACRIAGAGDIFDFTDAEFGVADGGADEHIVIRKRGGGFGEGDDIVDIALLPIGWGLIIGVGRGRLIEIPEGIIGPEFR